MPDIDELYRKAGDLRGRIGHATAISARQLFDVIQLVEELAWYLKQRADREIETEG